MSRLGGSRTPALVGAGLLFAGHFLFRPTLSSWEMSPDLLAGGLLLAALHVRAGTAAATGFTAGLLEATVALVDPAALAAVYAIVGYGAVRSWQLLFADARLFLPSFFFVGSWLLIVVKQWIALGDLSWYFVGIPALVAAVLTAVVAGGWQLIFGDAGG